MRVVLNISAVLVCGTLAGISSLAQSAPSRAASEPAAIQAAKGSLPEADLVPVGRSGSVEAHFAAANTTHDGHLTRAQALAGDWSRVAKHFDEIDTDHAGWISVAQIHAFNKSHHKHRKSEAA